MTLRSRLLDLLPIMVVFAVVAAFGTFVLVEYVVREPLRVPAPQQGESPDSAAPSTFVASGDSR